MARYQFYKGQPVAVDGKPGIVHFLVTNQHISDYMGPGAVTTTADAGEVRGMMVRMVTGDGTTKYRYVDEEDYNVYSLLRCIACGYVDKNGLDATDQVHEDHCCQTMVCSETNPMFLGETEHAPAVCIGHTMGWNDNDPEQAPCNCVDVVYETVQPNPVAEATDRARRNGGRVDTYVGDQS